MTEALHEMPAEALWENISASLRAKDYRQLDEHFAIGMARFPDKSDKYGDPLFRKEYVRYLVGRRRWDEAEAVVRLDVTHKPGWHHVLFARAFSAQGRPDDAKAHWKACLKFDPAHTEAQIALLVEHIKTTPSMEPAGAALLGDHLARSQIYLEYGCGGSSVLASSVPTLRKIYSVDSDRVFLGAVKQKIKSIGGSGDKYVPIHVDIGPTGDWGRPTNPSTADRWPSFANKPWSVMESDNESPDLILIDGRFRVACFAISVLLAPTGCTILFDDYFDRPFYHVAQKHLPVAETAGRMAKFVVPKERPKGLVQELMRYCTKPN